MDPIVEKTRQPMFAGYPFGNSYDEMFVADHGARDHCQRFLDRFSELGKDELNRRWYQAATLVHENGWDYSDVSDYERSRPWKLDVMPLLFSADDWQVISQGLEQRALLMDAVLKDIYGPRQSLRDGLLPPQFVFANPGFERAYCGLPSSGERHLHIYAADIARGPDGRWVVVADRANAPLGMGYALENRIVMSQVFPKIFRDQRIQRLVGFFDGLRERLQRLAPRNRDNPHVVLLTEGHQNPNHFEDSYLARYLGFTMVEGGDLAVRDNRVYLKTLGGLLLVDVVFRRL
ncbi:MAG: putative circularly permuted ATP-grasp superfamily protein, partial [Pirellulaceae bacterium]